MQETTQNVSLLLNYLFKKKPKPKSHVTTAYVTKVNTSRNLKVHSEPFPT